MWCYLIKVLSLICPVAHLSAYYCYDRNGDSNRVPCNNIQPNALYRQVLITQFNHLVSLAKR